MPDQINLQNALRRIERLEGALMGFDCFVEAVLKALPAEAASKIEKWAEVLLVETKTALTFSPNHSDQLIAGLEEFARTLGRYRRNQTGQD